MLIFRDTIQPPESATSLSERVGRPSSSLSSLSGPCARLRRALLLRDGFTFFTFSYFLCDAQKV